MDYSKIDLIVEKIEKAHMMKNEVESREILAVTQAYRILRIGEVTDEPKRKWTFRQFLFNAGCILDHPLTWIIFAIVVSGISIYYFKDL